MPQFWKTDPMFSDHMVLQRNSEIPVWGEGADGLRVTVKCGGETANAVTGGGKWKVHLPPMEAGGPYELTVQADGSAITFSDVWIGDVWLAGGQSNMEWRLKDAGGFETEIAQASSPAIRYYDVPRIAYEEDGADQRESAPVWKICTPDNAGEFSAVAYHFARTVHARLGVPIGIVGCNFGGTSASCWVAEPRLEEDDDLRVYLEEYREQVKDFDWEKYEEDEKKFQEDFAVYMSKVEQGVPREEIDYVPWPPPMSPKSFMRPNGLYGTMLSKAAPYGLKGFIYYQGESDAHKPLLYDKLLTTLIDNWRKDWGDGELPFLFVQLAAFGCDGNPDGEDWAVLRESQTIVAERVPNTGMAVALDCGEEHDIHPKNKKTVGERLALVALDRVYGLDVPSAGPEFESMDVNGGQAILRFAHCGDGLAAGNGKPLAGFELCGEDGRCVPAFAEIDGVTVRVWSPEVQAPRHVRYGWANFTEANLTNSHGLPAVPFRTRRQGRTQGDESRGK